MMNHRLWRSILAVLLSSVFMLALAGLAGAQIPSEGRLATAPVAPRARVEVRWLAQNDGLVPVAAMEQAAADFNAAQTAISLTLETVPGADLESTLRQQIGSASPPDIVGETGIYFAQNFHGQWLDLTPLIAASGYTLTDYYTQSLRPYQEDGQLLGLPLRIWPSYVYYNRDLFDAAGLAYPPHEYGQPYTDPTYGGAWTVDKLAEVARLLTLDNNGHNATNPAFATSNITQFGYVTQWSDLRGKATLFGAGSFVGAGNTAQIPPQWSEALGWYYDGLWGNQPFIPNDRYLYNLLGGNAFNSGRVAMAHVHLWYTCCLGDVGNWDIAATPAYSGAITSKVHVDGFRILQATPHPTETFEALTYLLGDGMPTLLDNVTGELSSRLSRQSADRAELETAFPGVDWQVLIDSIPYADDPHNEGYLPNFGVTMNRITAFHDLYHGRPGLDIGAELDTLREDLQAIFDGQIKQVEPGGGVNYGDELTYTVSLSVTPATPYRFYDPLTGVTFKRFVEQPAGIIHANGVITGAFMAPSGNSATIAFVVEVQIPTTPVVQVVNRACFYPQAGTLDDCQWTNHVYSNLPNPEVTTWKWTPPGHARPGGVFNYGVWYANNGGGYAHDVLLVDTLPLSTTWAGDNSGVMPEIGPNGVITWHLGTLAPGEGHVFVVTVNVDEAMPLGSGSLSPNCLVISTATPGDTNASDDTVCTNPIDVGDDEVELSVDKWPNLNDAAPGQEFEYTVQVCNHRSADVGPVWFTDTLPLSTTFVSWNNDASWAVNWTPVITTGGQIVFKAAGFPGHGFCHEVRLRLLLDPAVPLGTVLHNAVTLYTPNDMDLSNNQDTDHDVRASGPRYDLRADKSLNSGSLVTGGFADYHLSWWNQGNSIVQAWFTDTLPVGTTYRPGSARQQDGGPAFPPILITDQYVVWDLGEIGVNQGFGLDFTVDISTSVTPDTVITNCATIGSAPIDEQPNNNTACHAETIFEHGPQLRVRQDHWWNGDNQLGYNVRLENVGDEPVALLRFTDTYPLSTTVSPGSIGWDNWVPNVTFTDNYTDGQLILEVPNFDPGWNAGFWFNADLTDPNARPAWYTNTAQVDPLDAYPADNIAIGVNVKAEVERAEMWVSSAGYNMWGRVAPDAPVTVTTPLNQYVGQANGNGDWNIDNVEALEPGSTLTVTAGNGVLPLVIDIPAPFTAYASSITDTVWGQIDAAADAPIRVELYRYGGKDASTDGSGHYSVTWNDVPRGGEGHVRYETTLGYAQVVMHRRYQTLDLIMTVNPSHDWVEGRYEPGHTVWITVTASDGITAKGTAVLTTEPLAGWGGQSGFATHLQGWTSGQPDILPGDWVYGSLDNVYTSTVQVGTITGDLDIAHDAITGTVTAPVPPQTLNAQCWIDGVNNTEQDFTVYSNDGAYSCNFSASADLVPGQNVTVQYQEPDGDWVRFVFRAPAPHVKLQKQANGQPSEGSNFVFRINYENNGDADAENLVITDTLIAGMTYLTDTTGLPHSGTGGPGDPIVWQLGTLPANTSRWFDLFVHVTANAGETITNLAQIATSNPYDEYRDWEYNNGWGKESWWQADAQANDTHLNIGTWPWTGDPVPGYDVVFTVNPCNNGSTASSQVTITDTLHPSLTLQTWWGQYPGWIELFSDDHTLVVAYPTVAAGQCAQLYVRAQVAADAWSGMPISNTARVDAANDLETDDNEHTWQGSLGEPRVDLNANIDWNWGQLTPGGQIRYNINFNNGGNVPVNGVIRLTETLPVSTTFNSWNYGGGTPLTLIGVTGNTVVWEMNGLDNGYGDGLEVILDIAPTAIPGAVLTNTVEISPQPQENDYDNNHSTAVETLYGHGPNLRVRKWGDWHGDFAGHAWYQFTVENIGDAAVAQAVVTDTYPLSMTMEGGVGTDWNRVAGFTHDPIGHWFTATLNDVHPAYRLDFNFNATMADPVPFGLVLTNTVAVPHVAGDTNAADDVARFPLGTGPDLYVEKTLSGGTLRPGELITFSLRYGNDQPGHTWWWNTQGNVQITDTLPTGLEYITSTMRWCGGPECPYITPDITGNQLVFQVGLQNAGGWNEIYLTVRVTDTAQGGDLFTNQVDIASDLPATDIEPYYDNNHAAYTVLIDLPAFEIGKTYASSRVAGTVVTYTLTVTNVGTQAGTNITLIDQVPTNLTPAGTLSWTLASLAPQSADSVWFARTLGCTAGASVNNTQYRVTGSDQGVTTTNGAPISFNIVAPTITANFSRTPDPILAGQSVVFTGTGTTNGTALSYAWNFGDGTQATGSNAAHVYAQPGTYTVVFTTTDTCGFVDTHTAAVAVASACTPVTSADFTFAPQKPVVHTAVTFTATAQPISATTPITYAWNFGDGSTASQLTPAVSHSYHVTGTRSVTLTVSNACTLPGVTATRSLTVAPYQVYLPLVTRN